MKPTEPSIPLDDLMAAALDRDLTSEERTQFEARLQNDSAARAAYEEAKTMHTLLEGTYTGIQPDLAFEQRMVSGVRRRLRQGAQTETPWESLLVLWKALKALPRKLRIPRLAFNLIVIGFVIAVLTGVALGPITSGINHSRMRAQLAQSGIADPGALHTVGGVIDGKSDLAKKVPFMGDVPFVGRLFQSKVPAGPDALSMNGAKTFMPGSPAQAPKNLKDVLKQQGINYVETAQNGITLSGYVDSSYTYQFAGTGQSASQQSPDFKGFIHYGAPITQTFGKRADASDSDRFSNVAEFNRRNVGQALKSVSGGSTDIAGLAPSNGPSLRIEAPTRSTTSSSYTGSTGVHIEPATTTIPQGGTIRGSGFAPPPTPAPKALYNSAFYGVNGTSADGSKSADLIKEPTIITKSGEQGTQEGVRVSPYPTVTTQSGLVTSIDKVQEYPQPQSDLKPKIAGKNGSDGTVAAADTDVTRKLIRNADLELEVKNFQTAIDGVTALSKAAGGYVDSSNSQRGGNGKLQGTIIIKVLPGNLDAVLLKLRDLGEVRNQSVKTDDVTKDYYDTVARLDNSRKTEEQLQELLKRNNGKVSELLQVERELGRVRGEIEQMQGSLKFYDFLVQYATVTIALKEKDLNQAAAYLLQEQDNFSLFATDVEATFKKARQTAEDCKAQILNATLNHNSGSDVQAELVVMVPPDQIESFLTQIRGLGRIANFTRQSHRVAKDGGDSDNPADQTLTEKDKVQVHLSIRSDDESRKQVALVVVTPKVDEALDQAKTTALANAGTEILASSLNRTEQGQSSGQLRVRVPGKSYQTLLDAFRALGRTASFSLQRDDNSGPGANGDEAPVIVSLALTDTDVPLQLTEMSVIVPQVDDQAQQIKKDAATAGVEIKASSFTRQPDGREVAQLSFRLPMSKYPAFIESLKNRGKVEVFTVNRSDRPDQTRADATAPVEINLVLHNQAALIADNTGLWATLRQTFGEGAGALFSSIRTIGVLIAFVAPWLVTLILIAWLGRRLYLWRKK